MKNSGAVVNNNGLIASTTDPAGFQSTYDYDAMGRLRLTTYPSGDTVAWKPTTQTFSLSGAAYGLNGTHWVRTTQTDNQTEEVHFDAMLRPALTRVYDAADPNNTNRFVVRRFEFGGQPKFESYPQRSVSGVDATVPGVSTEYDALGRVARTLADSEQGQLITTHSYDSGYVHITRNPRNYETRTEFFALDEPDEKASARITLADNTLVEITRDVFGKTSFITRSGNGKSATRTYDYDQYERLCRIVEPETGATIQTYDNANNVRTRTPGLAPDTACTATLPAANTITFTYDGLNRLKNTTFGDGSPGIFRSYTKDSLLEMISSDGADWSYGYNKRRLPTTEKLVFGGATYQLTRGYNSDAAVASLTYPDNSVIQYSPNALNEARQVGSYASNISYHPNGAVAGFVYGNGIRHLLMQHVRGLPELSRDDGVLNDLYSYDRNGNVAGITDQQMEIATRSMEYDAVDRLAKVTAPNIWGVAAYGYDALDNLTSSELGGSIARYSTHTFDSATNRLTSISSNIGAYNLAFGYDARGNISQRGTQTYVFDLANRMRSATGKANYGYDGHGRRVQVANVDGTNRIQVYDQAGQLRYAVQTGGPNPAVTTKYIYLNRHVLAEVASGVVQYDHTDAIGSPVARTNAAGAIVSRTRYEPYGMTAAGTNPDGIGFTGHVNDVNTGLVQMQQRYYDPMAGRFMSMDPVLTDTSTGGGFNRYNYANNSPYKYFDPDGRIPLDAFKKLGLLVRNEHVKVHKTGVIFKNGFPDFSPYAVKTVEIKQTGNNVVDFAAANLAAGLEVQPKGYTWHHHENGTTMQLVPTSLHGQVGHSGGAAYVKALAAAGMAVLVGDTGAAVLSGEKAPTASNVGLSVQDFMLNILPFSMSINSAGEGSDQVPQKQIRGANDEVHNERFEKPVF